MHLHTRNVNTAFRELVELFSGKGEWNEAARNLVKKKPSRVGDVLMIEEPVTITYTHPRERVLFNSARDANPFFHMMESLWMLAGRRDIAPLAYYSSGYAKQVQDGDNPNANGAYGYRWRHSRPGDGAYTLTNMTDQLQLLIQHLKADPNSRRAVLQMWNVEDDLLKIGATKSMGCGANWCTGTDSRWGRCPRCGSDWNEKLGYRVMPASKDVCCNTAVYFLTREQLMTRNPKSGPDEPGWVIPVKYLDMTVTNRSNDLIWGTLGANVVHFSFLQEYMAAHLGCEVGVYNQFSNNLHVYVDRFEPEKWLADNGNTLYAHYKPDTVPLPLIKDPTTFDKELPKFVEIHSSGDVASKEPENGWKEPFLENVASPMLRAFHAYKRRGATTLQWAMRIEADDWRIAATDWLERRLNSGSK